ncbi:MAG: NADH-quinone oxidoreductase subunit C [Acidimicrobiales bacterium]
MTTLTPEPGNTGTTPTVQQILNNWGALVEDPGSGVRVVRVSATELPSVIHGLAETGQARLADVFGAIEDGTLVVRAVYSLDHLDGHVVVEFPVEGSTYPQLSDVAPAAFLEECEIYEQFGIHPDGGKLLNRVVVSPGAHHHFPRLGSAPRHDAREMHARHFVEGEAIEFPYGPVRGVGLESLYAGLVTSGEEVIDLYLLFWHKHRGIERRLSGLAPDRGLFFVERAEGLSAVANGWAFCQAVEASLGITVAADVQRTRAVALELERLYNHASAVAALAQSTGLAVGQAQAEIALEQILRVNLSAADHRYLFGLLSVGGVNRPLDQSALATELAGAYDELRRVTDALMTTNSFLDRLEACGIVGNDTAQRLGLVGPVARASGQDLDCRRDHPAPGLDALALSVPTRFNGDALSRMQVMLFEVEESVRRIGELCEAGLGASSSALPGGGGAALGWSESSRGETLAWVSLDSSGHIARARLRPASARNWRAFDDAARSRNVFTDVPIIEASFWLTVAGLAR